MVYHAIVANKLRKLWAEMGHGQAGAAISQASDRLHFRFIAPPPLGVELRGQEAFAAWFELLYSYFPDLNFELTDVQVSGWPWKTRAVVRLNISTTLADGSPYTNEAAQLLTIRWGKLAEDDVFEDTAKLAEAIAIQRAHGLGPRAD
ncbi:nuclear transport factor 2 family protein [Enemella sp. A6]|uniref:nuclear transport factor 2 family protein n=1 Tax=Enemella sp. A6 TaxID=3440152 RepID=UPI003EBB095E